MMSFKTFSISKLISFSSIFIFIYINFIMDEKLQKDIFNVLQKHQRYDLISLILNMVEEIDSDYETSSESECEEEFSECGALPENPSYCISDEGFYSLN